VEIVRSWPAPGTGPGRHFWTGRQLVHSSSSSRARRTASCNDAVMAGLPQDLPLGPSKAAPPAARLDV